MGTEQRRGGRSYRRAGLRQGVGLLLEARAAIRSVRAGALGRTRDALLGLYAELGHLLLRTAGPGEAGRRNLEPLIQGLSLPLRRLYGRGFDGDNLRRMARFSRRYPGARERAGLKGLTWAQITALLPLDDPAERDDRVRARFDSLDEPELDRDCAEFLGCGSAELGRHEALVRRLEDYILAADAGFCLCERHRRFQISEESFQLDLLFFHRGLRRLFAVLARTQAPPPGLKDPLPLALLWLEQNARRPGEEPPCGLLLDPFQGPDACAVRDLEGAVLPWHRSGLPPKAVLRDFFRRCLDEAGTGRD